MIFSGKEDGNMPLSPITTEIFRNSFWLFRKLFQLFCVHQFHGTTGQRYHSFTLEVAQHPVTTSRAVPIWLAIFSWVIFRELEFSRTLSSSRKEASRLSKLFHMICSMSHITSENRLEISWLA